MAERPKTTQYQSPRAKTRAAKNKFFFTTYPLSAIIKAVKGLKLLLSTLAAATAATILTFGGGIFASATDETDYPDDFTRTLTLDDSITDYAIDGDALAIASRTNIYILTTKSATEC